MSNAAGSLGAKWLFQAATLSSPADLSALVTLSQSKPEDFFKDNTLRLLLPLLNTNDDRKSDKDTKLDVLAIMANLSANEATGRKELRDCLMGVSEWFDSYMETEEAGEGEEPELHKSMLLLLSRCWDYGLKTEDLLELTRGDRRLALETVVGVLEDGETYSTELVQRQRPTVGKAAQWEHELVCRKYEKPLILQLCRLVRGFTHPGTYFTNERVEEAEAEARGDSGGEDDESRKKLLALYSVDEFSEEMDTLLTITLRTRVVEKLSMALYDCLFADEDEEKDLTGPRASQTGEADVRLLQESDHLAVHSVHMFIQNLYSYASIQTEAYREHMLSDTLLVPRLILPYLDKCVHHVNLLMLEMDERGDSKESDDQRDGPSTGSPSISEVALDYPALVQGIASSLRTLVIASFRAPANKFVLGLLRRLNPTASLLRASAFVARHDYLFALLCQLNVNMGALDLSRSMLQQGAKAEEDGEDCYGEDAPAVEAYYAHSLLREMTHVFRLMGGEAQRRVLKRVMQSGALPVSRDTPSYAAVMSVLHGGEVDPMEFEGEEKASGEQKEGRAEGGELAKGGAEDVWVSRGEQQEQGANLASGKEEASKSLLGDLPSLQRRADPQTLDELKKQRMAVSLDLPDKGFDKMRQTNAGATDVQASSKRIIHQDGVPQEFVCAINKHIMKHPVRTPDGHVFEKNTIELWLDTRGQVCPITGTTLTKRDLEDDKELHRRIMRWHIMKTSINTTTVLEGDDLYDF